MDCISYLYQSIREEVLAMKVIRKVSVNTASEKLEKAATEKFVAHDTARSCLCRCSDG